MYTREYVQIGPKMTDIIEFGNIFNGKRKILAMGPVIDLKAGEVIDDQTITWPPGGITGVTEKMAHLGT